MDSYQAIYDAVRSKISGGEISAAIRDVAYERIDFGHARQMAQEEIAAVGYEMQRPSVLWRPAISQDGNQWCALYGPDLVHGVAGFGDTPEAAMRAFDDAWWKQKTSAAVRGHGASVNSAEGE